MRGQAAKSALRAYEIIEMFASRGTWLSVSEIADGLGYPRSSTSVLIRTLRENGYLEVDPATRKLRPALRTRMSSADLSEFADDRPVSSLVDWLSDRTGEEIIIAVQNGRQVQYVYRRPPRLPFAVRNTQTFRPLCRTSFGTMLLTRKHEAEIDRLVRSINAQALDVRLEAARVVDEVQAARERLYCFAFDAATPGAAGVAALLPLAVGAGPVAVGVCGESPRVSDRADWLCGALQEGIAAFFGPGAGGAGTAAVTRS